MSRKFVLCVSSKLLLLLLSHVSRIWLCNPIDGSPPGSPVPGILQARTLERVAISFSNAWKWKVKVKSLSHVRFFVTPRTAAYQAPPSVGFSRQEYWSGVPLPSPLLDTNLLQIIFVFSFKLFLPKAPVGFPDGSAGKESACNAGDTGDIGSIPGSGRSPGRGNGNPLQDPCLENPTDRGAW